MDSIFFSPRGRNDLTHQQFQLTSFFAEGICYGLTCALTEVNVKVIRYTFGEYASSDVDLGFVRNLLFWGNMKKLLEFFTMFGYNPVMREDVSEDDLPNMKEVRDYFLGKADGETYPKMRAAIGDLGTAPWRKKVGDVFGRKSCRWSHLYTSDNYSQSNPSDKGLSMLLIYILDLAIKVTMFEMSDDSGSTNEDCHGRVAKMRKLGLYMHKYEFAVEKSTDGKRFGLRLRRGGDHEEINDPAVFVPVGSATCPDIIDLGRKLFKPLRPSGVVETENDAKLQLEVVTKEQVENLPTEEQKKKRKAGDVDQETESPKRAKAGGGGKVTQQQKTAVASTEDGSDVSDGDGSKSNSGKGGNVSVLASTVMSKSEASSAAKQLLKDKSKRDGVEEMISRVVMNPDKHPEFYSLIMDGEVDALDNEDDYENDGGNDIE